MGSVDASADAAALLEYGWERLERGVLVKESDFLGELVFGAGATGVVAARTVRGGVHPERISVVFVADATLALPINAGERIGKALVTTAGGRPLGSAPALATDDVDSSEVSWATRAVAGVIDVGAGVLDALGAL
jgi:hypothetical protein